MKNSRRSRKPNLGVFHISCWVIGLVAFVQLMTVGMAVALRSQRAVEPEEKIVTEYVMVPAASRAPVTVAPQKLKSDPIVEDEEDLVADLEALAEVNVDEVLNTAPAVLDPVIEDLIKGAKDARIQGDLLLALTKLNEGLLKEPNNPNLVYELGVTHEEFGVFDKATESFLEVFKMGPKAGSLYAKAALKIELGFQREIKDLARLGWGRMTAPRRNEGGERRTLILPISVSPTKEFDPMLLTPRVRFYEEVDGKVIQATIQDGHTGSDWVTGVADWKDGEEMAEVWYFVPDQDAATGLLFGERTFHGFVAELYYDNRLIDNIAYPRTLLREGRGESTMDELRREFDELDGLTIEDLTAGSSLLPKLNFPASAPAPKPELPDEGN